MGTTTETDQAVELLKETWGPDWKPKLFVYGIFLSAANREHYGMTNPQYATVRDYATFGGHIVKAVKIPDSGLSLTGLLVTPSEDKWRQLDALEGGYDRVLVTTTDGERAYMYVQPERD